MVRLGEQLTGCCHKGVGLGLQLLATALLDLGCALSQSCKETVQPENGSVSMS